MNTSKLAEQLKGAHRMRQGTGSRLVASACLIGLGVALTGCNDPSTLKFRSAFGDPRVNQDVAKNQKGNDTGGGGGGTG